VIDVIGECSPIANSWQSGWLLWSKVRWPPGAVLHLSDKPGDLSQSLSLCIHVSLSLCRPFFLELSTHLSNWIYLFLIF